MWHAKFKIKHKDCWILPRTVKYNISVIGIPLNFYEKNNKKFHTGMAFLQGEKENKLRFIESLKKDKQIKKFKVRGDQVFVLIQSKGAIANSFDQSLFFIKPVLMKDGFEYWEIGSWDKKTLVDFYDKTKKISEIKILQLKRGSPSVFIQQALPKLTEKQKNAFELASNSGYYSYPRKISVEKLAKKSSTPRTTFQEHLRKAESKLMEVLIEPLSR